MGFALILIGIVLVALTTLNGLGIALIVIGLILFFVPSVPYGYSSWHGRRGPPL